MRLTIIREETACDYLNKNYQDYMIYEVDEIVITFISDLKDMTLSHYMAQPKSMPCRKQVRKFIADVFADFDYKFFGFQIASDISIFNFLLYKWRQ